MLKCTSGADLAAGKLEGAHGVRDVLKRVHDAVSVVVSGSTGTVEADSLSSQAQKCQTPKPKRKPNVNAESFAHRVQRQMSFKTKKHRKTIATATAKSKQCRNNRPTPDTITRNSHLAYTPKKNAATTPLPSASASARAKHPYLSIRGWSTVSYNTNASVAILLCVRCGMAAAM